MGGKRFSGQSIPIGDTGYNILAVLTFTSAARGTINFYGTRVSYTTSNITMNTPETGSNIAFTVASLPALAAAGGKIITFAPTVGNTMTVNAIAVNGGNTILIQGNTAPFSGVCQF